MSGPATRRFRDEPEQDAVRPEPDHRDGIPCRDPRPADGLHGARERLDERAVLEREGVRKPQSVRGDRGRLDANVLGEPAGMEARLLPLGAHDVLPGAAEAAGAAGRVVVHDDAVAGPERLDESPGLGDDSRRLVTENDRRL